MTTAGGWGVVTADAITRDRDLDLIDLPDDLREAVDAKLPTAGRIPDRGRRDPRHHPRGARDDRVP
jgi:acetyltransferase